jgi:hypothetical protein
MLLDIEDLTGSGSADVLTGDDDPNAIGGGSGPDLLAGAAGDDILVGVRGSDQADVGMASTRAETEVACEADPPPPRVRDGGWLASWEPARGAPA